MRNSLKILVVFFALALTVKAELIVDQVPPSLLTTPGKTNAVQNLPARQTHATRKLTASSGARWEKFEADFGITNKDSTIVGGSLQTAKYQLDQTTFALQEFVNNVENLLRFDYGVRDLVPMPAAVKSTQGSSGNLLLDTLNATRFKSDIDLNLTGRQFVGVKLVLPIGN